MSSATQYSCKKEGRRDAVRSATDELGQPLLNGIDFLEVDPGNQQRLDVYCIHPLPPDFHQQVAVVIEGGVRIVNLAAHPLTVVENRLEVETTAPGDFSTYTLRLVQVDDPTLPPAGFDPQLSQVEFSFKVGCPSEFDCQVSRLCPPQALADPDIHYLAKDYGTFRRLMLDRLSVIMPDWQERSPADLQIVMVELLAYVGDYLSYYQDAVATEAYLGTARRRISVRRHARLLDYFMHEGCNARSWVVLEVEKHGGADGVAIPPHTPLLTRGEADRPLVSRAEYEADLSLLGREVFETMGDKDVTLRASHNVIHLYTWSDQDCCLPKGATRATLQDWVENGQRQLQIRKGDFLLFEEVVSPVTGVEADADPTHRQVVRLHPNVDPVITTDPLTGTPLVDIEWLPEDALTFSLCISSSSVGTPCSVARGNVVLADHGRTLVSQPLSPPVAPDARPYRPVVTSGPLTFQGTILTSTQSASAAMQWDVHRATPSIFLHTEEGTERWTPQADLLSSDEFSAEFVVEMESDGTPHLRFGDGILGKRPPAGTALLATYRAGNGSSGNVGSGAIGTMVWDGDGIITVRNPLPASGGVDPESLDQVRHFAPQAFRRQERAVTESDYGEMAGRHPEVQKATCQFRWTGSWYTAVVTVDRKGGRPVDPEFIQDMTQHLERYRMAGQDVEIQGPMFVPLDIVMQVCVAPGYFRSGVKQGLLDVFSSRVRQNGQLGFFHPDNFTFGQPLYLSQLYEVAMQVDGVASVDVVTFQRWGSSPRRELEQGLIRTASLEIVQLANDPNFPENGKMDFAMMGGM